MELSTTQLIDATITTARAKAWLQDMLGKLQQGSSQDALYALMRAEENVALLKALLGVPDGSTSTG